MNDESKLMLKNSVYLLKRKYRGRVLWALVRDISGKGSGSSVALCREMDWNPHQNINDKKPLQNDG